MYKKIIIFIVLFLLVGCTQNDNLTSLRVEIDVTKQQIELMQQTNEEQNIRINQLMYKIEKKDSEIQEMQNTINNLNQSTDSHDSSVYKDYKISFTYDAVRELDSFSSHYGIISNYDKNLKTIEVTPIEFVYNNDHKRIEELNIDITKIPVHGDAYIYFNHDDKTSYELSEYIKLYIYDWHGNGKLKEKSLEQELDDTSEYDQIYIISMIGNKIIRITEYRIE